MSDTASTHDEGSKATASPGLQSPLGILGVGILVVVMLFAGALILESRDETDSTPSPGPTTPGSGAGQISADMPLYFTTDFSEDNIYNSNWPQGTSANLSREIMPDGVYRIENRRIRSAIPSVFESTRPYDNLTVQMQGRLADSSTSGSAFGIVFRYVDDDNYNVFAIDGQGRYSIWVRDSGQWIELRNPDASIAESWTPDEAVNPLGRINQLRVEIRGNAIYGYVNGERLTMVEDDTIASGDVGIYVASTEGANATALIDMFGVMEAPSSMTGSESMTYEDDTGGSRSMTGPESTDEG